MLSALILGWVGIELCPKPKFPLFTPQGRNRVSGPFLTLQGNNIPVRALKGTFQKKSIHNRALVNTAEEM